MTDKKEDNSAPKRDVKRETQEQIQPGAYAAQAHGKLVEENAQLKQALAQARAEAERFSDSLGVLLSAPRPTVHTILGPVEATAAGLNRVAVELYVAHQRIQQLEAEVVA